jgi:transposase-like protein
MPNPFERRYTPEQRAALAEAYEDRGIRPYKTVVTRAAAGTLPYKDGQLAPFETNASTVTYLVRQLRKRRAGAESSHLATLEPRDAIEALRRRLVALVDRETAFEENKKDGALDPERLRQLARAAKEVAAIPGPKDARPVPGGARNTDGSKEPKAEAALGGKLLHAHRQGDASPAQDDGHGKQGNTENDVDADASHAAHGAAGRRRGWWARFARGCAWRRVVPAPALAAQ